VRNVTLLSTAEEENAMTRENDPRGKRRLTVTFVACAISATAALTACSSSSSSSSSSAAAPTTGAATPSAPATAPAASAAASTPPSSPAAAAGQTATQKTIAANWTAFFNPKEPVAKRITLLENGQQLSAAVKAQAGSAEAAASSSKVDSVSVTSATQAKVTYDILLNGAPVLKNQSGSVILQDGTWKVADTSFCGLLALQGSKSLPAACKAS
jgi:hypothetical protein